MGSDLLSSGEAVLRCTGVKKTFLTRGRRVGVLDGVDLAVARGKVVAIVGKSGAGKSTLLNIIGGLDSPDSGSVSFMNRALEKLSTRDMSRMRREAIGLIFQNFNLIESWTAFENVEAALVHKGLSWSAIREQCLRLLEALGLGDRMENFPRELSMGEAQRVAVARTLVNDPVLVLADEPTGSVDPETGGDIAARLIAHARENDACLVVATHGAFPLEFADAVFRLEHGRLWPA